MRGQLSWQNLRLWGSLASALALGPAFILVGHQLGLVFSPAAAVGALVCVLVIPLLTIAGGRFKFVVWQVAVISMVAAVIGDDVRVHAMQAREIPSAAYVFWAGGTLLSAPLPIYFWLKLLAPPHRFIGGVAIAVAVLGLWLGIQKITH